MTGGPARASKDAAEPVSSGTSGAQATSPPADAEPSISKPALKIIAALALGLAVAVWVADGNGGRTTVTTTPKPSTTTTVTTAGTVVATTVPGTLTTTTTPGSPARSSELSLVLILLGVAFVFGAVSFSSGRITGLNLPGGGGFTLGTTAQAQLSGSIAQKLENANHAQAAYAQSVGLLRGRLGKTKLDTLPAETVEQVVSEAIAETAPQEGEQPPPSGAS
jgi:hypothetical protein